MSTLDTGDSHMLGNRVYRVNKDLVRISKIE